MNKKELEKKLELNIKKGRITQQKFWYAKGGTPEKDKYNKQLDKLQKEYIELRDKLGLSSFTEFSRLYEISKIISKKS